jgi:hypothetical protein
MSSFAAPAAKTAVTSRYPRGKESAERGHRIVDYLTRRGHDPPSAQQHGGLAMCYPGLSWRRLRGRPTPRFRTFQVCPKDLRAALRQAGAAED